MRVQEYADIVNIHEKSKVVMYKNHMCARALCSVDIAIVNGNSIGGHVMETSAKSLFIGSANAPPNSTVTIPVSG